MTNGNHIIVIPERIRQGAWATVAVVVAQEGDDRAPTTMWSTEDAPTERVANAKAAAKADRGTAYIGTTDVGMDTTLPDGLTERVRRSVGEKETKRADGRALQELRTVVVAEAGAGRTTAGAQAIRAAAMEVIRTAETFDESEKDDGGGTNRAIRRPPEVKVG